MKNSFFVFLIFIFQIEVGHTQPGNVEPHEIAIEYSSLVSNQDSLNLKYQIVGYWGSKTQTDDSLSWSASYESFFTRSVTNFSITGNDSSSLMAKYFSKVSLVSDLGLNYVFLPMPANRASKYSNQPIQYTIKILEKRSGFEMYLFFVGSLEDFFVSESSVIELTNLSFAKGMYLFNLSDEEDSKIPTRYKAIKTNKRNSSSDLIRSCEISDLDNHIISRRKMSRLLKNIKASGRL